MTALLVAPIGPQNTWIAEPNAAPAAISLVPTPAPAAISAGPSTYAAAPQPVVAGLSRTDASASAYLRAVNPAEFERHIYSDAGHHELKRWAPAEVSTWIENNYGAIARGNFGEVRMPEDPVPFAMAGIDPLKAAFSDRQAQAIFNLIVPEGATAVGDKTIFRVWAPKAKSVDLIVRDGDGQQTRRLTMDAHMNHIGVFSDLPAGTDYMFRVTYPDGWHENLPDPFSRYQPDPSGGAYGWSRVVDTSGFDWGSFHHRHRRFSDLSIYEMHVGLWSERGTFNAIAEGADWDYLIAHLKEMGVNAIEIMPVSESPGTMNWGYDVILPFAVFRSYGTPAELQRLVRKLHEADFSVIFDLVLNHVAEEGTILYEYFTSRMHEDSTPWGPALRYFAPAGSRWGHAAAQNLAMLRQLVRMYIDDFGADGLRLDMSPYIGDPTACWYSENNYTVLRFLRETIEAIEPATAITIEDHRPRDGNLDVMEKTGIRHAWNFALAETLAKTLHLNGNGSSASQVPGMEGLFNAMMYGSFATFAGPHAAPPPFVNYLVSHDVIGNDLAGPRHAARDREGFMLGAALACLSRGAVLLFMGDEYGAGTMQAEGDFFLSYGSNGQRITEDRHLENFHFFRDMQRQVDSWRGYGSLTEQARREANRFESMKLRKRASGSWDEGIFRLWTALLKLRQHSDALRSDGISHAAPLYIDEGRRILIFRRDEGSDSAIIGINLGDEDLRDRGGVDIPVDETPYEIVLNTQDPRFGNRFTAGGPTRNEQGNIRLPLPPRSVVVLRRISGDRG